MVVFWNAGNTTKNAGRLLGVGVDVVDLKRAQRFIRQHSRNLRSFFLPHEYSRLLKSRSKCRAFALLFAAKEAVSKALGVSIAHPRQFRQYPIYLCKGKLRLDCRSRRKSGKRPPRFVLRPVALPGAVGVVALAYR